MTRQEAVNRLNFFTNDTRTMIVGISEPQSKKDMYDLSKCGQPDSMFQFWNCRDYRESEIRRMKSIINSIDQAEQKAAVLSKNLNNDLEVYQQNINQKINEQIQQANNELDEWQSRARTEAKTIERDAILLSEFIDEQ